MTTIKINDKFFGEHDGIWFTLGNEPFKMINGKDVNKIEITSDDLMIKGDIVSMEFKDEGYVGLVRTQPQRLIFHIKTKYLETIIFTIRVKLYRNKAQFNI